MTESAGKRPAGRPSLYSDELAAEIVQRLSAGEPLTIICRSDHMPCDDTVRAWADRNEAFSRDIARAREVGYDAIAWRARQTLRGKTAENGDGESTGDVQRDKAIADFDLKLLAKWSKRYSEKLDLTSSDGTMSAPSVIQIVPVRPVHDGSSDPAS